MTPTQSIVIAFSSSPGRGSGALFLPDGHEWRADVTIDGLTSLALGISPSAAARAAVKWHYRRASIPLPPWTAITIAQIEMAEAYAMRRATAAFADEVKEIATVAVDGEGE